MATTTTLSKKESASKTESTLSKSRKRAHRRLLARRQLSVRRSDLPVRQSAAARASQGGAHQAAPARALGHDARPQFHLRAPQSADQEARSRHDLHHRPRPWRAGAGRQHLSRRHLQRSLSGHLAGRGGHEAALHPVLVSRRNSEPRRAGDARLDPRGRRTWLCAFARLSARPSTIPISSSPRRRRRRSGDGAARDELAFQQVPQSGARRRRAADPASQRLQDRQSDRAGADQPRGARIAFSRLRLRASFRRRATIRR